MEDASALRAARAAAEELAPRATRVESLEHKLAEATGALRAGEAREAGRRDPSVATSTTPTQERKRLITKRETIAREEIEDISS